MSTLTGTLVPYTTLFRSVRLEEVAGTAQHLIEFVRRAVRQHRAAADRRGAVDARQLARRRFGERAGRACRHVDRLCLLIGDRRHEAAAIVANSPEEVGGELGPVTLFGDALPDAEPKAFIIGPDDEIDDARSEEHTSELQS